MYVCVCIQNAVYQNLMVTANKEKPIIYSITHSFVKLFYGNLVLCFIKWFTNLIVRWDIQDHALHPFHFLLPLRGGTTKATVGL